MNITSIEQLSQLLLHNINDDHACLKNCECLLKAYVGDDWKKYIEINNSTYNKNIVISNEIFDIVVITWNVNQCSKIHDHPKNGCLVKILQGELQEDLFELNLNEIKHLSTNILQYNNISYNESNKIVHKISNAGNEIAVSLHIYSPSKCKMQCYN